MIWADSIRQIYIKVDKNMSTMEGKNQGSGPEKIHLRSEEDNLGVSYGVIAANLYRGKIDKQLMRDCAGWMTEQLNEPLFARRKMRDLLNDFNQRMTPAEKREVQAEIGCLTRYSKVEVVENINTSRTWLLIFNNLPQLERIICRKSSVRPLDTKETLEDLEVVIRLGKFSRMACLRRLFDAYYGCVAFEEIACRIFDLPYYIVSKQALPGCEVRANPKQVEFQSTLAGLKLICRIHAKAEKSNKINF